VALGVAVVVIASYIDDAVLQLSVFCTFFATNGHLFLYQDEVHAHDSEERKDAQDTGN
jgi:hypothetical protein